MSDESTRPWQTTHRETVFSNPYWSYRREEYRLLDGKTSTYHYLHTPGSVIVVPLLNADTLLLVRQYRYPNDRESLEFPGGGHQPSGTFLDSAQTELREETGYKASTWQTIGQFNPCKGLTDELCTIFFCRDLEHAPLEKLDPFENTVVVPVSIASLEAQIFTGEIWCGMTIAAWYLARPWLTRPSG